VSQCEVRGEAEETVDNGANITAGRQAGRQGGRQAGRQAGAFSVRYPPKPINHLVWFVLHVR
jgi:hypothetical protein